MKKDYRTKPRRQVHYRAWLQTTPGAPAQPCEFSDISEGGARLSVDGAKSMPSDVNLLVAEKSEGRPCRVVWRSETEIGLRFEQPATAGKTRRKR